MSTEMIERLITVIEKIIDEGRTVSIKADEITINSGGVTVTNLEITQE